MDNFSSNEAELQSEYEKLGYLDVDQLENVLSLADNMAMRLAYKTSFKIRELRTKVKDKMGDQKNKVMKQFLKKKKVIERYMNHAPTVRFFDKISFCVGVWLMTATTFIVGKWPHDIYYKYHVFVIIALLAARVVHFRLKKWHYYMYDFCYYSNLMIVYYLAVEPKNEILFKAFFVFSQGTLGISIMAFKNAMIFHKIDFITSVAIHLLPLVTSWNLRWYTIPYE